MSETEIQDYSKNIDTPMVSVIIPMYNVEKYLRECLDSVVSQNYSDFEAILINDGSTDSTAEIAEEYVKRDIRFSLINKSNGGASTARNAGLKNARGKYILFLDSDDYLLPEVLGRLVNKTETEGCDIIKFAASVIDNEDQNPKFKDAGYELKGAYDSQISGRDFLSKSIESGDAYLVNCGHIFFSRELVTENDIYFREGIMHEDILFHWQIFAVAKSVGIINEPLNVHRVRTESVMQSTDIINRMKAVSVVIDGTCSFIEKSKLEFDHTNKWYLTSYMIKILNYFNELSDEEKKNNKALIAHTRKQIRQTPKINKLNLMLYSINPEIYGIYHKAIMSVKK